jgi:hypothetical protein
MPRYDGREGTLIAVGDESMQQVAVAALSGVGAAIKSPQVIEHILLGNAGTESRPTSRGISFYSYQGAPGSQCPDFFENSRSAPAPPSGNRPALPSAVGFPLENKTTNANYAEKLRTWPSSSSERSCLQGDAFSRFCCLRSGC